MIKNQLSELLLASIALPVLVQPAAAHSIWFQPSQGELDLLYGHPEIPELQGYEPTKLKAVKAFNTLGAEVPVKISRQEAGVSVAAQGKFAAITADFDNGFWINRGNDNFENVPETEAVKANPDYEVGHYLKYTKGFFDPAANTSQNFGFDFELVPTSDPYTVKPGENLTVQALYQGKPAADVTVEHLGGTFKTNSNGIAAIPIGKQGVGVVESADFKVPLENNPAADFVTYSTTLSAKKSVPEPSALLGLGLVSLVAFTHRRLKAKGLEQSQVSDR